MGFLTDENGKVMVSRVITLIVAILVGCFFVFLAYMTISYLYARHKGNLPY